jgi:predicted nucleic acid-binding protein
MILVDTSVWIDHLREADEILQRLLDCDQVITHPFVIGEIALGSLKNRRTILASLADLPKAAVATESEVLRYIDASTLSGKGIGYVDVHLLASAKLSTDVKIWTRDKKLKSAALESGLGSTMEH